jgi:hypothetical protein
MSAKSPAGFREVAPNVHVSASEVVVLGQPADVEDETHPDYHSCDTMGCSSVGPHVVFRSALSSAAMEPAPASPAESKPDLPGAVEFQLADWSQAATCPGPGGRTDDALVRLTTHNGKPLGCIPLGWFREHTTFALCEAAVVEGRREHNAAGERAGGTT